MEWLEKHRLPRTVDTADAGRVQPGGPCEVVPELEPLELEVVLDEVGLVSSHTRWDPRESHGVERAEQG
jgi:hypothetical protein